MMAPTSEFERDASHWLRRLTPEEWISAAMGELRRAEEAYARSDARAGLAGCKRAAGMALNGALLVEPNDAWGRTYVEHVRALARDHGERVPEAVRAACKVLLETLPPSHDLLSLRSKAGDAKVIDAARDVMAHAYAIVHGKKEMTLFPKALCMLVVCTCFACGGPQTTAEKPPPTGTTTVTVTAPPEDAGAVAVVDAAVQAPPDVLPPAKPTTIRLASPTGDAVDQELDKGDAAFEKNALDEARTHYDAAKKLGSKRAGPVVGIARVRIAKSNAPLDYGASKGNAEVTAAARELKGALALEKDYGPAHAELGRALLMLGDADGALVSLRRAAELLPNDAEAQSALGVALLATGHKDDALASLQRSTTLDMGSAPRHGNLGTVMLLLGRVNDAVHEFELQARLADGDARAHSDLGTALLAANQIPRAVTELERAVHLDGTRASYVTNLGYAYQLTGRRADAIAKYREALRIDDKFASAWIDLATALAQDPKTRPEARAALLTAQKIDPTDPRVKANLEELDALEKATAPHK